VRPDREHSTDAIIRPAAKLAGWLRGRPGVDAVALEAFPV